VEGDGARRREDRRRLMVDATPEEKVMKGKVVGKVVRKVN
jgi:hypothetical protein